MTVVMGIQQYDPAEGSPPDLLIDSASLVTSGMAGAANTFAGAYSGNGVVRATLSSTPVAVCSTAELAHIGSYRVFARLRPTSDDVSVRLSWRQGRDQWTALPFHRAFSTVAGRFWEVDLGEIKIRAAALGTQTWQGRIEAKSETAGDTVDVDYLILMPTPFTKARSPRRPATPTTFVARDEFDQTTGALAGKQAPVPSGAPGVWAGAGDGDDFTVNATDHLAQRTAVSDTATDERSGRFAVVGSSTSGAVAVHVDHRLSAAVGAYQGPVARYTDVNNWLIGRVALANTNPKTAIAAITKCVAGTVSHVVFGDVDPWQANAWQSLELITEADGRVRLFGWATGAQTPSPLIAGSDSALASGGALASGKVGVYDWHFGPLAATRSYDSFYAYAPEANATIFANQSLEFRSYGDAVALREDSTGTYWGEPGEVRGGRPWLPQSGDKNLAARIVVMARREDIDEESSVNIADSTSLTISSRSRWINIPRQG